MKIDRFYLKLFLRPDVFFTYLKRWWLFGERPPKETMLVSDRPLTKEEFEYGASLEPEALRILQAVEHTLAPDGAGVCRVINHVFVDGVCAECGASEIRPAGKA